jgi:putative Holliday junction resolvase
MIMLGLDFGERRIGVAVSDPLGSIAAPLSVIERESIAKDIAHIGELARRRGAASIVLGLPLNMDGSPGSMVRRVRRFASALQHELEVDVTLWDERLSTREAERALLSSDESRKRRREVRDAVAAALILQSYLDAHRDPESNDTPA